MEEFDPPKPPESAGGLKITLGFITLLKWYNNQELAKKVRNFFDKMLQPKIKDSVEEVLNVTVTDFLSETNIETARTGAIAIFELQLSNATSN
jgi:uncharacterized protein YbcI